MIKIISAIFMIIFSTSLYSDEVDFNIDKYSMEAKKSNKHIILFLHKDNCGFCERMSFTLEEDKLSKAIKKDFILLDINRDDDEIVSYQDFKGSNAKFLKALGVNFYPLLMFINPKSNKIIYTISGYKDSDKVLVVLDYIKSNSYTKMTLEEFEDRLFFNE
ncbi:Thioredoxin [hydrothermal vent metagenome]|uniref:Thioredoxin n=1 Tax=hydrothermal vent metagenome TaxID=652676 RepID=A0A1W1EJF4_9ZZZZ